jgi:hypothetical protein
MRQSAPTLAADARVVPWSSSWDTRLHAGLRVARVPEETRAALARALGEAGVEAEFVLALIASFPLAGQYSHTQGEIFLTQLEAIAHRLMRVAATLEVSAQGFLSALEAGYPDMRTTGPLMGVWWPDFPGFMLDGEPLELRLRRCGFAYRHVAQSHIASNVEAVIEQMALTLHALSTIPPAGVMPAGALYQGLYELASAWQGDLTQSHLFDISPEFPGLLSGISWLRSLDTQEDTSLESDLAWARAQYALARAPQSTPGASASSATSAHLAVPARYGLADFPAREWEHTIALLDQLRRVSSSLPGYR